MVTPFRIVIPARYGSTRLPAKALLPLAGRPMIVHVCERALEAGADVYVATDDERIRSAVAGLPVQALLTRADHSNGTARIAEVAERLNWAEDDIVVNLQGDEPLMRPELIRQLAEALAASPDSRVATLATPIEDPDQIFDPHTVKTVLDRDGHALYFSRAPIPWHRHSFGADPTLPEDFPWLRHIGIYAYAAGFLRRYAGWSPSRLEAVEALEQLRILWHGERILVLTVADAPAAGVDTHDDWRRVEAALTAKAAEQPGD